MKAMILAAGVGTRLDPLTLQLPKPLVPIANLPVMDHILHLLSDHKIKRVWANLHYLPDLIQDYYNKKLEPGIEINYLLEEKLTGDAGGVRACANNLQDGAFLVIMGDVLTNIDLSYVMAQHRQKRALATIALKAVEDVQQFGVAVSDKEGWIKEFQEKPEASEARSNLASTGIYILEPAIFDYIPKMGSYGFGKNLFPDLVNQNLPVLAVEVDGYWSDVGTFEKYRQANFDALSGREKLNLSSQYKLASQYKADLGFEAWLGKHACIEPNCLIEGKLILGNNSVIESGVKIFGNVIIGDDCIIESGAVIKDTIIWSGSRLQRNVEVFDSVLGLHSNIEANEHIKNKAVVAGPKYNQENVCKIVI